MELADAKQEEIIESEKYLSDTENYKHHPESVYTSQEGLPDGQILYKGD
nr:2453_t:CDS:2 [Entrophospora candida]CAG8534041.1 10127_t:CDS:2 [Entrophospora candida]